MCDKSKSLFEPIVPIHSRHPMFEQIRTWKGAEPAREMMNEVFQNFPDADGNFVEQFQTTGFDSRVFELYLFAYLSQSGYEVSRDYDQPDFLVTNGGISVAIEATTVNPTLNRQSPVEAKVSKDLTEEQILEKIDNELPIKFGSPLFSKLRKKYWELEHCKEIPLVLAIEAFHEQGSLYFSDSALSQYLYGLRHFPTWTESGKLVVKSEVVGIHQLSEKVIPSNFFGQPDTEYVSAVLFSNSGTFPKFERMGYQAGHHRGNIFICRTGTCYNPDPNAAKPLTFSYELDDPPLEETWSQGLVICYNPSALYPIPRDYFVDAAQHYLENGVLKTDTPKFHPFASTTLITLMDDDDLNPAEETGRSIGSLLKSEFDKLNPSRHPMAVVISEEKQWFADRDRNILGVVIKDKVDDDWLYILLGRDERAVFRAIDIGSSIKSRNEARRLLLSAMENFLLSG